MAPNAFFIEHSLALGLLEIQRDETIGIGPVPLHIVGIDGGVRLD
jgi:hypothetical protein